MVFAKYLTITLRIFLGVSDLTANGHNSQTLKLNRTAHIRHQWRKVTALSGHRWLINTGVEKMN
jgi:hypothetical protein